MAINLAGRLFHNACLGYQSIVKYSPLIGTIEQVRNYAARKGTRMRKAAELKKRKALKAKLKKSKPPASAKMMKLIIPEKIMKDDSHKPDIPLDDVYVCSMFKSKVYLFEEAIQCHRELHHPTVLNCPDAQIETLIDLNLQTEKKTKLLGQFSRVVAIPNQFSHGTERKVVAFCKSAEQQEIAKRAGAVIVGGRELVNEIQGGGISPKEFDYFVAHPEVLPDLVGIKGLLKLKYPNYKMGTLNADLAHVVDQFKNGIEYKVTPHPDLPEYARFSVPIGSLNMDVKHLEENFAAVVNDVMRNKPRTRGDFITRTHLMTLLTLEELKVDFRQYIKAVGDREEDNDREDNSHAVISAA